MRKHASEVIRDNDKIDFHTCKEKEQKRGSAESVSPDTPGPVATQYWQKAWYNEFRVCFS